MYHILVTKQSDEAENTPEIEVVKRFGFLSIDGSSLVLLIFIINLNENKIGDKPRN